MYAGAQLFSKKFYHAANLGKKPRAAIKTRRLTIIDTMWPINFKKKCSFRTLFNLLKI